MKIFKSFVVVFVFFAAFLSQAFAATSDDYYQAGKKLYAAQDYNKAILYFGAAVKLDPNNVGALQGRGSCYYALGQYQNALTDFQQVQALRPSDQMAAFIERVRAKAGQGGSAVPPSAGAGNGAMAQGIAFYQQRQYSQAVDSFEQATQQDPQNYKPFYYLGLARMMNGDKRGATLSLTICNELHPSAGLSAYVDKLKASLSGDDQSWVQANLNSYDHASASKKTESIKNFGVRFEPGIGLVALGDFNADGQTRVSYGKTAQQNGDPSFQVTVTVPSAYPDITIEPTLKLSPNFEIGLPISVMPVGSYSYIEKDDYGSESGVIQISGFGIGLNGRMFFGEGPVKFFGSAGPVIVPVSLSYNYSDAVEYGSGLSPETVQGTSSSMAIGGQVEAGADMNLGDFLFSGFLGYRFASASGFTTTATDSVYGNYPAQFYVVQTTNGNLIELYPNTLTAPSGSRPLTVDLSSILAGIQLSLYF